MALTFFGTPVLYLLIRSLFKFVLKVFYSSIIIENAEYIEGDGIPTILCANHSNSLTDALIMITSIPLSKRKWLRMTAKSTLFGKKTFSSWLIESVGTVPVKRAKDFDGKRVDNSSVFEQLIHALEREGDMVCLFPEGISHYSPGIVPLRAGVARITSDVLRRNADNPDFELTLLTCSITYLHRQNFRSDVLVSFNPPIKINTKEYKQYFSSPDLPTAVSSSQDVTPISSRPTALPRLDIVKQLTSVMEEQIRYGTIDAPNFGIVRIANTARRLYAPFGTAMSLGEHVHITQRFVDAFAKERRIAPKTPKEALFTPLPALGSPHPSESLQRRNRPDALGTKDANELANVQYFDRQLTKPSSNCLSDEEVDQLAADLHAYQDILKHLGLKDDRIRRPPMRRVVILKRLFVRLLGACGLLALAAPGLALWTPVFLTAGFFGWRMRSSGKLEDVWDEIAHTKLIYGLTAGVIVWTTVVLLTLPIALLTFIATPIFMWLSLRWLEDGLASLRAAVALLSMLLVGKQRLAELRLLREDLRRRIMQVAVERADLPSEPEDLLARQSCGRARAGISRLGYFSIRRRRKKDYNETMRLWDVAEFPNI